MNYIRCEAQYRLGLLCERRGHPEEAAPHFREAEDLIELIAPHFEPYHISQFIDLKRQVLGKQSAHTPSKRPRLRASRASGKTLPPLP